MPTTSAKFRFLALVAAAGGSLCFQPVHAADLPGGYHPKQPAKVYRQRTVTTTYVTHRPLDCIDLRITEWGKSRMVEACHPPLDLAPPRPKPGGGSGAYATF